MVRVRSRYRPVVVRGQRAGCIGVGVGAAAGGAASLVVLALVSEAGGSLAGGVDWA